MEQVYPKLPAVVDALPRERAGKDINRELREYLAA